MGKFVKARENAPEMLDFVDEALNQVSFAIQPVERIDFNKFVIKTTNI